MPTILSMNDDNVLFYLQFYKKIIEAQLEDETDEITIRDLKIVLNYIEIEESKIIMNKLVGDNNANNR